MLLVVMPSLRMAGIAAGSEGRGASPPHTRRASTSSQLVVASMPRAGILRLRSDCGHHQTRRFRSAPRGDLANQPTLLLHRPSQHAPPGASLQQVSPGRHSRRRLLFIPAPPVILGFVVVHPPFLSHTTQTRRCARLRLQYWRVQPPRTRQNHLERGR